jgi:hypothetical protein
MGRSAAKLVLTLTVALLVPACSRNRPSGATPGAFALSLPAASASDVSVQPTYSWTASSNVISYLLQVSADPAFGVVLIHRTGLLTLADTPPTALSPGATYYWRVYAVTSAATVLATGSPAIFTTLPAPGSFSLQSPSNGAVDLSTSPLLSWSASAGAETYTLQIATDAAFTAMAVNQAGIASTSFVPSTPLSTSTTYFWRISAVNGSGSTTSTGAPRSFTTLPPLPGTFTLTAPASGAITVAILPTYSWSVSSNAASYTLQVSTSLDFSSLVVNSSGLVVTSESPAGSLSPATTYYWRVTAVNSTGSVGATGAPASFTTADSASISISTTSMSFSAAAGGANPTAQDLQITNPSGTAVPLRWSISSDRPWLQFSALSGTTLAGTDVVSITPVISQTEAWTTITTLGGAPGARENFTQTWTGQEMIVWGGSVGGTASNDGACYDPAGDAWVRTTSQVGAPAPRIAHTAIWTGSRMLIWGGRDPSTMYGDGYLYNPRTDTWSAPISSVNAPSPRVLHSAVWTGTEMLVWGGHDGVRKNDGARYNPATDTWAPLLGSGAPSSREDHFAVWTGTQMLIWGGEDSGGRVNTGKRYDPASNTWGPDLSTAGAPTGRAAGASAWTGSEMFVWGGITDSEFVSDVGGRYDPSVDGWQPTTLTNALSPRRSDQAVWAGSEMLVWGGYSEGEGYMNSGKRYRPPISLAPGTYTGTLTITDPDAGNSPRTISVTLTVNP